MMRGFTHVNTSQAIAAQTAHASVAKGVKISTTVHKKAFSTSKLEEVDAANEAGSFAARGELCKVRESL